MRSETKDALEQLLNSAETGDCSNLKEAARIVRRDLINGGRHEHAPSHLFVKEEAPVAGDAPQVVYKPKVKT